MNWQHRFRCCCLCCFCCCFCCRYLFNRSAHSAGPTTTRTTSTTTTKTTTTTTTTRRRPEHRNKRFTSNLSLLTNIAPQPLQTGSPYEGNSLWNCSISDRPCLDMWLGVGTCAELCYGGSCCMEGRIVSQLCSRGHGNLGKEPLIWEPEALDSGTDDQ